MRKLTHDETPFPLTKIEHGYEKDLYKTRKGSKYLTEEERQKADDRDLLCEVTLRLVINRIERTYKNIKRITFHEFQPDEGERYMQVDVYCNIDQYNDYIVHFHTLYDYENASSMEYEYYDLYNPESIEE